MGKERETEEILAAPRTDIDDPLNAPEVTSVLDYTVGGTTSYLISCFGTIHQLGGSSLASIWGIVCSERQQNWPGQQIAKPADSTDGQVVSESEFNFFGSNNAEGDGGPHLIALAKSPGVQNLQYLYVGGLMANGKKLQVDEVIMQLSIEHQTNSGDVEP